MESEPKKKFKGNQMECYQYRHFSDSLSVPFQVTSGKIVVNMYVFGEVKGYGILLPIVFSPLPTFLQTVGIRQISKFQLQDLIQFQNVMWCDFFLTKTESCDTNISFANYLVVPLKGSNIIAWKLIKIALGKTPAPQMQSIPQNNRQKYIYKKAAGFDRFYYLANITERSKLAKILNDLPEKSLYSQTTPENIDEDILEKTQQLIIETLLRCDGKDLSFILCRPTRLIRKNNSNVQRKIKPGFLRLVPESELSVCYLKRTHYKNAARLLKAIIDLERFTHLNEFCSKYNYTSEFKIIRDATTAPVLDHEDNYDSLEHLGDSVLKLVSSLILFHKYPKDNEGVLTDKRTGRINNKFLSSLSLRHELFYYLRGAVMNTKQFRPAHYCGASDKKESYIIQEKFSDGTLADLVESMIGAFYYSSGFLSAATFIQHLKMFPKTPWPEILKYFSNDYISLYKQSDLIDFKFSTFSDLIQETPYKKMQCETDLSLLESIIGYSFTSSEILTEALTHTSYLSSKNYERLEFLGDAVMDIIVASNMFSMGKFSAEKLTVFKHMLVNNNIFAKLSLSLGLHRFLRATPDIYAEVSKYLNTLIWEENILEFGVYASDPPKILNDLFEAVVGAVLIDSRSVDLVCKLFAPLLKKCMVCLAANQQCCDMNIRSKLSVYGQRKRLKIKITTEVVGERVSAKVLVNGDLICEHTERTAWLAKQLASASAYSILTCK